MEILLAVPLTALMLATNQATAACTYIQNTYTGIAPANSETIVQGPFTITGANGCRQANISATINASGSGSPPHLFIERLNGSSWSTVDGGNRQNVSALGQLGTYRVLVKNEQNVGKAFFGTIRYGR